MLLVRVKSSAWSTFCILPSKIREGNYYCIVCLLTLKNALLSMVWRFDKSCVHSFGQTTFGLDSYDRSHHLVIYRLERFFKDIHKDGLAKLWNIFPRKISVCYCRLVSVKVDMSCDAHVVLSQMRIHNISNVDRSYSYLYDNNTFCGQEVFWCIAFISMPWRTLKHSC